MKFMGVGVGVEKEGNGASSILPRFSPRDH